MTQPQEGIVSRHLNRRLSRPLSALLARTPVTPNQVSLASFAIALISLALFLFGFNIWAGLAAQSSSVVDGVDGELARRKGMATRFGGFFDAVLDRYADVAILAGLTYWAFAFEDKVSSGFIGIVGLLAIVGALMVSYTRARAEASLGVTYHGLAGSLASRDARLLLVMIGAVIGQGLVTLVVLALLTNGVVSWRLALARTKS
ncbi:CDP-alcohol phosphatidyltransferase family protein [Chloroflexota bacterium]